MVFEIRNDGFANSCQQTGTFVANILEKSSVVLQTIGYGNMSCLCMGAYCWTRYDMKSGILAFVLSETIQKIIYPLFFPRKKEQPVLSKRLQKQKDVFCNQLRRRWNFEVVDEALSVIAYRSLQKLVRRIRNLIAWGKLQEATDALKWETYKAAFPLFQNGTLRESEGDNICRGAIALRWLRRHRTLLAREDLLRQQNGEYSLLDDGEYDGCLSVVRMSAQKRMEASYDLFVLAMGIVREEPSALQKKAGLDAQSCVFSMKFGKNFQI